MLTELVISTYQKPQYLKLALSALAQQTRLPDSVCIADDGSDDRTSAVIEGFRRDFALIPLRHVWHPDLGFRKTRILNDSVRSSTADYLIFIDDDCLMHPRFVERHLRLAAPGRFVTGSVVRLGREFSRSLLAADHMVWTAHGRPLGWAPARLSDWLKAMPLPPGVMGVLDALSPIRKSWAGGNSSTLRANILAVNGFDEAMAYGGEDKEFGVRLGNAGIRGRTLRYSAPLYHLDHPKGYIDPDVQRRNREMIVAARTGGKTRTEQGIAP